MQWQVISIYINFLFHCFLMYEITSGRYWRLISLTFPITFIFSKVILIVKYVFLLLTYGVLIIILVWMPSCSFHGSFTVLLPLCLRFCCNDPLQGQLPSGAEVLGKSKSWFLKSFLSLSNNSVKGNEFRICFIN